MTDSTLSFHAFSLTGDSASEFLQGQITADVEKLTDTFTPSAICNLKGRVDFGFWIKKTQSDYHIVISADCADAFAAHIKKYGAFSKITLSDASPVFVAIENGAPTFSDTETSLSTHDWLAASIAQGNTVITDETRGVFQPQELRLHQRDGVHYDKGCYLGQEVVARIWFKAAPKTWLHRVSSSESLPTDAATLSDKIKIVTAVKTESGYEALVVARPEQLAESSFTVMDLPEGLNGSVAKP